MNKAERLAQAAKLRIEHAAIISTPSVWDLGPDQFARFSPKKLARWKRHTAQRMAIESQINELSRTDEELAAQSERAAVRRRDSRKGQLESQISYIQSLGRMSHKASGDLKKPYALAVQAAQQELATLLERRGIYHA